MVKVKESLAVLNADLISARALSILSSLFSTRSGTLHPKAFAPARVRSTWVLSLSVENRCLPTRGTLGDCSTRSRTVAARVLMSAAVSEPNEEMCSPPFFGRRIEFSMVL